MFLIEQAAFGGEASVAALPAQGDRPAAPHNY